MQLTDLQRATTVPIDRLERKWDYNGILFSVRKLSLAMEPQTQSNWCWAATSVSVNHYYWFSSWTQCKVAGAEQNLTTCCQSPVPGACNVAWYLEKALTRTGNFVSVTGPVSFARVKTEIDAGRPVGVRVGWGGGGGHFLVIEGYSRIGPATFFDLDDPIYGESTLSVDDFSTNYQGSGTWTHTYFTKTHHHLMPIKPFYPRPPILEVINTVRPLVQLRTRTAGTPPTEAADAGLGLAHRLYSLGLDALAADRPAPTPVGVRVYETRQDTPFAFYDVTDDEAPRVLQMSAAVGHLKAITDGLSAAVATASNQKAECELKLLRIPALNFEAIWLDSVGQAADQVVPLRSFIPRLAVNQAVPWDEAMAVLKAEAAAVAAAHKKDDTLGS